MTSLATIALLRKKLQDSADRARAKSDLESALPEFFYRGLKLELPAAVLERLAHRLHWDKRVVDLAAPASPNDFIQQFHMCGCALLGQRNALS